MKRIDKLINRIVESLDPEVFTQDKSLKPEISQALKAVADDLLAQVKTMSGLPVPVLSTILTGSEVGPDFDSKSDFDLHLVVDYSEYPNPELVKNFLAAMAKNYNNKGYTLKGKKIEVFFQDSATELVAPGVYDLVSNSWVKAPSKEERTEISLEAKNLATRYSEEVKNLYSELDKVGQNLTLDLARGFLVKKLSLEQDIRQMRREGLSKGLFGDGNIAFKLLRRDGTFDKLNKIESEMKKKLLFVEDLEMINRVDDLYKAAKERWKKSNDERDFVRALELFADLAELQLKEKKLQLDLTKKKAATSQPAGRKSLEDQAKKLADDVKTLEKRFNDAKQSAENKKKEIAA